MGERERIAALQMIFAGDKNFIVLVSTKTSNATFSIIFGARALIQKVLCLSGFVFLETGKK